MKKVVLIIFCLAFVAMQSLNAQVRRISGTVTSSEEGSPIPGASVVVKGTTIGTITDIDGNYALNVPGDANTLVVSFVGMKTTEVPITGTTVNIKLTADIIGVDEVIVVAFGTAKKGSFTGAATQINAEKLEARPISNVLKAVEGSTPGVQVTSGNGQPGSGNAISIRGFGSISASNEPLYVVDGVPYMVSISNLNVDDIESISILKDAATTALYGSRAANGVVMITTKKGKINQDKIQVKISQGFISRAIPEYERVNSFDYYPLMWEYYRNGMVNRTSSPLTMDNASNIASGKVSGQPGIKDKLGYNPFKGITADQIVTTTGTLNPAATTLLWDDNDWAEPLQRVGNRNDYSLSLNGGSQKTQYYSSLGYVNEKGFLLKSDFERFSGRISLDSKPKDWMKMGLNLSGNLTSSNFANDGSSTGYVNPFFFSRTIAPIYPVYAHDPTTGAYILDAEGKMQYDYGNSNVAGVPQRPGYGGRHVVAETLYNDQLYKRRVVSARSYVDLYFLKDFKFTTNIGVDINNYNASSFDNRFVGDGAPAGRSSKTNSVTTTTTLNQLLSYAKSIGKHRFDALIGHESYKYEYNYLYGFRQSIILDGNTELVNFTTTNSLTSYTNTDRLESYLSRVNYDFAGKYFLSASYRYDGSSRFYPDTRWGGFWSAGGAWRIDQESFIKNLTWINMMKLRASYGETGNNDVGLYSWQALYFIWNNALESGFLQSSLENSSLTWEKNGQMDLALEFGLFNRINGTIELYNRQSSNLLFSVPQPLSSGIENQTQNVGTMYNRGIEAMVSGDIVKTKDFNWNLTINASTNKNQITKMPESFKKDGLISGTKKLMEGHSIYDYWLRDWYGVDPDNGAGLYIANKWDATNCKVIGADTVSWSSNNARYHYAGKATPEVYGSFTNTLKYKNLELSVMVSYGIGGKIYESLYGSLMSPGYGTALHKDILRRWQKPGDITDVPRLDEAWSTQYNAASDRWLTDASYLNIKQVNLSYQIPSGLLKKVDIDMARLFVSGENLWLFTKLQGMNVQQNFSGTVSNVYVPARIITIGLNVTL